MKHETRNTKHETRNCVLGHTGPAGVHLSSWEGSESIFRETVALFSPPPPVQTGYPFTPC